MSRVKNIRNRSKVTNPHIKLLIKECLDQTQALGYYVPAKLRFLECKAKRRAGLACYTDTTIVLSTFIYKEKDIAIKSVIYHEIAHIVAGPGTGHGSVWKHITKKISRVTGVPITVKYSDKDMPVAAESKKYFYRYYFYCTTCGAVIRRMKETEFVKTYNQKLANGQPRWTCSNCHGVFEKFTPSHTSDALKE